jgi:integrase/recombinase XerD
MGKINRCGQAKILTNQEMVKIFRVLRSAKHQAIFGLCRYTIERISAILQLQPLDVFNAKGELRSEITFRSRTRKAAGGKPGGTRQVPLHPALKPILEIYGFPKGAKYLFASPTDPEKQISRQSMDLVLRRACNRAGIGDTGISLHSFRRTGITAMAKTGVGVRVIQKVSGHRKLEQLKDYIEVGEEEVQNAISCLP